MTLVGFPPVTDAVLMQLSEMNHGWSFERDDEGAIEVTPTPWKSGGSSREAGS
jgi:heme/copper-type cytochrome/quinol oxidase subunit 1